MIKELIVLNGGKEYHFIAGQQYAGVNTIVRKIELIKGKYIVFLENHREVEINCQNVIVITQY